MSCGGKGEGLKALPAEGKMGGNLLVMSTKNREWGYQCVHSVRYV